MRGGVYANARDTTCRNLNAKSPVVEIIALILKHTLDRTVIERSLRRIIQLSRYLRLTSRGSLFLPIQPDNSGRGHNHRKNSNGIASQAPPTVVSLISAYPAVLDILNHSVIARFATVVSEVRLRMLGVSTHVLCLKLDHRAWLIFSSVGYHIIINDV